VLSLRQLVLPSYNSSGYSLHRSPDYSTIAQVRLVWNDTPRSGGKLIIQVPFELRCASVQIVWLIRKKQTWQGCDGGAGLLNDYVIIRMCVYRQCSHTEDGCEHEKTPIALTLSNAKTYVKSLIW